MIYFKYQNWTLWFICDSDTLIVIIRQCICYRQLWYLLTPKILIDTLMLHPKGPYSQIDRMPSTLAAMLSLFAALRSAGSWGTPQGKVILSPWSVGRKRPRETHFNQKTIKFLTAWSIVLGKTFAASMVCWKDVQTTSILEVISHISLTFPNLSNLSNLRFRSFREERLLTGKVC